MALSQIQCLDDNHVNPRTHESKPDFFYCEDQRFALEVLLQDGREAFVKYLESRGLRGFLSDPELETLSGAVEPFDPGLELFLGTVEDDQTPLSLHYWPDLSDTSVPQLDLGWPHNDSYRGVTRTSVYTQPPLDGQAHIKEVVRKMIAQAQKVIAVVMDVFTDVDIFRDLLDAGFKRKVSVYILLERTGLPHFLSMCHRANMHPGHLKHLRVCCSQGAEFYTRFCTKVRGQMGHRFMFIDGDKAVSGSYSFTWMSSRLDRNLITVTTGQAVDAFDQLFRFLYMTSSCVDLQQVAVEPEPEPDLRPQIPTVAPPSADIARKLFSPKYALVALSNPSPTSSIGRDSPKEPEIIENSKKKGRKKAREEAAQDALPLHPGLTNLEKACLITYLPTWPEPDPPSDVIGFINIRDANKQTQVHMQRSEMFETSQAIRFSSPISRPQETLPEVAKPRQLTAKHEEVNKLPQVQSKSKAEELVEDQAKPSQHSMAPDDATSKPKTPEQKSPPCRLKSESRMDKTYALKTEGKLCSTTSTKPDEGHNTAYLNGHKLSQSTCKTPTALHTAENVSTNGAKSNSHPESNSIKAETVTNLNVKCAVVNRSHTLESNGTQTTHQPDPSDSNTGDTQEKTLMLHRDSHTKAVNMQPDISSEMTHNLETPSIHRHISTASAMQPEGSTFLSKNNLITTAHSSTAPSSCTSVPPTSSLSIFPSPVSSVTTSNPPLPSSSPSASSYLTSSPPIPKLRTVHLVFKDGRLSNNPMLPEIWPIENSKRPNTNSVPEIVLNEVAVGTMVPTTPVKEPESAPELLSNSASNTGDQKYTENTNKTKETSQKQNVTSQEIKCKEAHEQHDRREGAQSVTGTNLQTQSDVFITDTTKTACLNIKEVTQKDGDSKTLTSETERASAALAQASIKTSEETPHCEFAKVPNVTQNQTHLKRAHGPQRASYSSLTPQNIDLLEATDSFKGTVPCTSQKSCTSLDSADDSVHMSVADKLSQLGKRAQFISGHCTNSIFDNANHDIDGTIQELTCKTRGSTHTLKKSLCLQVSLPNMSDFGSPTSEQESRSLTVAGQTPSPDGFPQRPPTPDSQSTTPDPRSYIPDFLTPTSDISDGYISPREDSTTSEEYYECSEFPLYEPVFDFCGYQNHGTKENLINLTHSSPLTATAIAANPAYFNYSLSTVTLLSADQDTSCSETQTLSCSSGVSFSSLIGTKGQKREMEDASEEIGEEVDIKGEKLSHVKKRTELDSQGIERAGSDEASRMVEHFKQDDYSTETAAKGSEARALKRKRVQNQLAPDRQFDARVTAGESASQETESQQLSTGVLKPKTVSSERVKPDKASSARERALNQAALRPSNVEMTESQSTREPKGHKQLQQQDIGPSTSTRSLRSPRSFSASQLLGARPSESCELNQTESKLLLSSLKGLDNLSPRKPPSRQSPPVTVGVVGSAAGRKQISRSQQSLPSQQPPAAQIRARAGQSQSQAPYPKPQPSFLHTYSNLQPQVRPHPTQMESTQEAHEQEQGRVPFNMTFSRLYNIKGSKEKMSKMPAQSNRGSASPPVKGRKSSS